MSSRKSDDVRLILQPHCLVAYRHGHFNYNSFFCVISAPSAKALFPLLAIYFNVALLKEKIQVWLVKKVEF